MTLFVVLLLTSSMPSSARSEGLLQLSKSVFHESTFAMLSAILDDVVLALLPCVVAFSLILNLSKAAWICELVSNFLCSKILLIFFAPELPCDSLSSNPFLSGLLKTLGVISMLPKFSDMALFAGDAFNELSIVWFKVLDERDEVFIFLRGLLKAICSS